MKKLVLFLCLAALAITMACDKEVIHKIENAPEGEWAQLVHVRIGNSIKDMTWESMKNDERVNLDSLVFVAREILFEGNGIMKITAHIGDGREPSDCSPQRKEYILVNYEFEILEKGRVARLNIKSGAHTGSGFTGSPSPCSNYGGVAGHFEFYYLNKENTRMHLSFHIDGLLNDFYIFEKVVKE
jgi:hypothetical protein